MKKSKFLKKSLAMLLALMLVVAMIPLSASAALPDNLTYIYMDQGMGAGPAKFGESYSVKATTVKMSLVSDLGNNYELRVKSQVSGVDELTLSTTAKDVAFAQYRNSSNVIEFTLYERVGTSSEWSVAGTYTITVETKDKSNTTNLDPDGCTFTDATGVYSATVDNINGVVNVVLARNTKDNSTDIDDTFNYQMNVKTLDGATVKAKVSAGGETFGTVPAKDGATFMVYSEDESKGRQFTVKATYLDALKSVTITGMDGEEYTGTPVDTDYNNVPDTITVTLPVAAISNSYGEPQNSVSLAVSYEAEGHNNQAVIGINDTNNQNDTTFNSNGVPKVTFTGFNVDADDVADRSYAAAQNYILVTRLDAANGTKQFYNLKVQVSLSASTDVVNARVNRTVAEVDNTEHTIVAYLPNAEIVDRNSYNVELWLAKGATAKIDNNALEFVKSGETPDGIAYDAYEIESQNLYNGKVVTVTPQNGGTPVQYKLTVARTTVSNDATITAFWLKDPDTGKTYAAKIDQGEDNIVVTVPYMTTTIKDWIVFVTPGANSYIEDPAGLQVYSNRFTATEIGFNAVYIPVNGDVSTNLTAVNKNDTKIKEEYKIHVKLDTTSIPTGHKLSEVWFTAQSDTHDSDKVIYRSIRNTTDTSCNLFDHEVEQETNGNRNVITLNVKVPRSLFTPNDLGIDYQYTVTDFSLLNDEGVAFIKDPSAGQNAYTLLSAITTTSDDLTGSILTNDGQIVVLPYEVARWALTEVTNNKGTNGAWNGYNGVLDFGTTLNNVEYKTTGKKLTEMGTVYNVVMKPDDARNNADLESMSIGTTPLTINSNGEITGTLNFSQTVMAGTATATSSKATFVEFELSDYAMLVADAQEDANLFSNGDIDGDGVVDDIDDKWGSGAGDIDVENDNYKNYNNWKLIFERVENAAQDVKVYVTDGGNKVYPLDSLVVKAENRLTSNSPSTSTYKFKLTWAAPNEEAEISSFSIGDYTGTIVNSSSEERTITVQVPYGTDVTGLVATFTASAGSTVVMESPESNVPFVSGVTSVNYTNPVKVYVTSEDTDTTHMYTITVEEGLSFSDVSEDAWYYDNVMDAANNGYVSGMGDGTFDPLSSTTRAQFAAMIANAMGYEEDPDAASAFPDVADDFWGKSAINFCYENEIITGYDDGEFKPNQTITRQEAAAILNNAFELAEKYGISDELFPDDSAISTWAEDHVYAAKAAGLMKGDADTGNFRPTSTITRAEAASIMMNAQRAGVIN